MRLPLVACVCGFLSLLMASPSGAALSLGRAPAKGRGAAALPAGNVVSSDAGLAAPGAGPFVAPSDARGSAASASAPLLPPSAPGLAARALAPLESLASPLAARAEAGPASAAASLEAAGRSLRDLPAALAEERSGEDAALLGRRLVGEAPADSAAAVSTPAPRPREALRRRIPILTAGLLAAHGLVYAAIPEPGHGDAYFSVLDGWGFQPARLQEALTGGDWLAAPRALASFVTSLFIHQGPAHFWGNMAGLALFGGVLERSLGRRALEKVYLLAGVGGGALTMLVHWGSGDVWIGASGAVAGLIGASWVAAVDPLIRRELAPGSWRFALRWAMACFGVQCLSTALAGSWFRPDDTGHEAHLAGMLVGIAFAAWHRLRSRPSA
ncbi:MAG: rhomboid family intramembrane serine protease [Elusimicrobia bacterium]|nr:rhomboid family intramembrane serine protease [Elusimicrobiota bacterium]